MEQLRILHSGCKKYFHVLEPIMLPLCISSLFPEINWTAQTEDLQLQEGNRMVCWNCMWLQGRVRPFLEFRCNSGCLCSFLLLGCRTHLLWSLVLHPPKNSGKGETCSLRRMHGMKSLVSLTDIAETTLSCGLSYYEDCQEFCRVKMEMESLP